MQKQELANTQKARLGEIATMLRQNGYKQAQIDEAIENLKIRIGKS